MTSSKEISIVATGDSIITTRQSVHIEKEFLSLTDLIKSADVPCTNLETTLHNFEGYPSARLGGPYLCSAPSMIEELKWMGFRSFSCANNHATDYSEGGLIATIRTLDQARVVYAGIGMNLEEARAPAFLETSKGRVGFISAASETFGLAGPARKDMQGRPGFNPLRYDLYYEVSSETIGNLRELSKKLGILEVHAEPGEYYFLDNRFVKSDQTRIRTVPNKADAKGNLESIKEAKSKADWILFAHHCHQGRCGRNHQIPAEFMERFAHESIDEGVHAYIGHGYHALRGIEIYKGRPIFYSLGNFIYQTDTVKKQPAEFYEYLGLDPQTASVRDLLDAKGKAGLVSGRRPNEWSYEKAAQWESVIPYMRFKGDTLSELTLYPISLGSDLLPSQRGRPRFPDKPLAEKILRKLQELSAPYNTKIEMHDGIGKVRLEQTRSTIRT